MLKSEYTWIQNTNQFGCQTEEGQWHSVPHPHLVEQVKKEGYSIQFPSDEYWHPDYVIFKGRREDPSSVHSGLGWFISRRKTARYRGPFKTKGMAKRAVLQAKEVQA